MLKDNTIKSGAVIINKPVTGQIVGGWIVTTSPTSGRMNFGTFSDKDEAVKFATGFDFAEVSPVYWSSSNRG